MINFDISLCSIPKVSQSNPALHLSVVQHFSHTTVSVVERTVFESFSDLASFFNFVFVETCLFPTTGILIIGMHRLKYCQKI